MSEERNQPAGPDEPGGDDLGDIDLDLDQEPEEPLDPAEPEGEEPSEPDEEPPQAATQRRPGRREREAATRRENRELRERLERLERDQGAYRQQQTAPPRIDPQEQQRRDEAEFNAALAQVPFEHQASFSGRWWAERTARQTQQAIQQSNLAVAQALDKSAWDSACRLDPTRAAFADRVERLFNERLQAGRGEQRETIFYHLLGQEADRQRTQRTARQRRDAAGRVRSQTTRPAGARSDGARPGNRAPADDYEASLERLKGRPLW